MMTQEQALDIMKIGKNIFLTGGAGTGKTYVLNQYIQYLREHDISVALTASTGIAATHIGGMTIHAWSGIGVREYLSAYDLEMLEEKKYLWDRYQAVQVLIIDEISMLPGNYLEMLDQVCRTMKRDHEKPFGGIQVVLCGDLFQLPPVSRDEEPLLVIDMPIWRTGQFITCYLTEQYRQQDDVFTQLLQTLRTGTLARDQVNLLASRIHDFHEEDFSHLTKLFTHNHRVDDINDQALARLEEHPHTYVMTHKGRESLVETLKKGCLALSELVLKKGAEVMFIKNNFEKGYVNGTRGKVIDFSDELLPIVETSAGERIIVDYETWSIDDDHKVLASLTQIPLRHAWAITVHKSQGMSLDAAVIDLSQAFGYGMGYVALSRVRSLSGLYLVGFSEESLAMNPRIIMYDRILQQQSDRAVQRLLELTPTQRYERHEQFILASGGTLEVQSFKKNNRKRTVQESQQKTHDTTYQKLLEGKTLEVIATERQLGVGTIIEHIEKNRQLGKDIHFKHIRPRAHDLKVIRAAFRAVYPDAESGPLKLGPVKKYLDDAGTSYSYDAIRLAKIFIQK